MQENAASQSAAVIAAHRAMESTKPEEKRVCYDPYAAKLIAPNFSVIGETEMPREQALALFKQFVPGFHEYFIARTRYIDDYLSACIKNGMEQLVILGAGYDSRAYRFDTLKEGIAIFEVDHPATQAVKKDKLGDILEQLPNHVTFVPVDFKQDDFGSTLTESGYNTGLHTLFIWEGVTMYLRPDTVEKVLGFVTNNSGAQSSIIFDFTFPEIIDGAKEPPEAIAWRSKANEYGEPLQFGISLNEVTAFLEERNFTDIFTADHSYFKQAYFSHPEDERVPTSILVLAHATVAT